MSEIIHNWRSDVIGNPDIKRTYCGKTVSKEKVDIYSNVTCKACKRALR